MRAIAINGSPRKNWNTGSLLEHALAGAAKDGAETELVHLYDHVFKGCVSCFACKKIGGQSYGRCAVNDGLTSILKKASEADVLILGTPVYFGAETGEMRSFLERFLFPFLTYTPDYASIFPGKLRIGLVYTMNIAEKDLPIYNYDKIFAASQGYLSRIFGNCDLLLSTDTYQFSDYSKYLSTGFDAEAKKKRREEVFPQDCRSAFELGARLTATAKVGVAVP
ncbi:MAG: flavodoxin family protein [Desulfuromonadales bacterium]|nr:flavodoxin family protein [Desulfuromonadales bacterium]MDW7756170.1 flavodoxin family protein [Desulfuromonadales bacterium]